VCGAISLVDFNLEDNYKNVTNLVFFTQLVLYISVRRYYRKCSHADNIPNRVFTFKDFKLIVPTTIQDGSELEQLNA